MTKKTRDTTNQDATERDFQAWKKKHNFDDVDGRKEFEAIKKVRDKYWEARVARENSCYWYSFTYEDTNTTGTGGDWARWWEQQEKAWAMWYQPIGSDGFQSNVKSPMTTGRIESTLNKFKRLNYRWDARPTSKEDKGKEKVAKVLLDYWFNKSVARNAIATWVKDSLIHGSAIARLTYQKDVREYQFPKDAEKIVKQDKAKKDKDIDTLKQGRVVYGDPKQVVKFEDLVLEPKPIQSVWFDPMARSLHGQNYPARYAVERRIVHIDDFHAEFDNDPNASNIDKVLPTSAYSRDSDYYFFEPPHDVMDGDFVEILEYENEVDDDHIILANDILIKWTPLPYNHKELTYHKLDCIEFIHQFYHVGIPDFLMNIQGTQEILMNMLIDYIFRSMNLKYMVDANSFGEFTEAHMRDDSQYIAMDSSDGRPMNAKVMQLTHQPIGFDPYKLHDLLERDATLSSQIDPSQMSLMPPNVPATLGVMNKEQVELMMSSLVENFANGGLMTLGRQIWAMMQQKYSKKVVKEIVGEDNQKKQEERWKEIRLEGLEVVVDKKGYNVKELDKNDYSFFEIKGEYINTSEQLDVMIAPDSLQMLSKGLEMQKSKEAYAQLMPNAADPSDPQTMQAMNEQGRIPLYNIRKLAMWYAESNDIPDDILIHDEEIDAQVVDEAIEETKTMSEGEEISGEPGRPRAHWMVHYKAILEISSQIDELDKAIRDDMEEQEPELDAMGEVLPPMPEPQSLAILKGLNDFLERLQRHMALDLMPEEMAGMAAMGEADRASQVAGSLTDPQPPAPPEEMMPEPPMGSQTPMPGDDPGNIPMPQSPEAAMAGMAEGAMI